MARFAANWGRKVAVLRYQARGGGGSRGSCRDQLGVRLPREEVAPPWTPPGAAKGGEKPVRGDFQRRFKEGRARDTQLPPPNEGGQQGRGEDWQLQGKVPGQEGRPTLCPSPPTTSGSQGVTSPSTAGQPEPLTGKPPSR